MLCPQVQVGASGPVRLLFTENTAVVEFWDDIAKRYCVLLQLLFFIRVLLDLNLCFPFLSSRMGIVSMELFDATPREFSVLDYLFNPNSTQPISSFDAMPLEVASQAFWSRTPSRFLSVTSTQQGITSRQLLVGTVTDQV